PAPHHRIRPPQPRSPTHHTPHPNLITNVSATRHHDTPPFHQHNTTNRKIPTRDRKRGNMKSPSPLSRTGSPKQWWPRVGGEGRANLSPRFLPLPSGPVDTGRGGSLPETVLKD